MLGSDCHLTHRNVLYSAEAPRRHLVAIAFLFVLAFPKTAEQTPSSGAILPSSPTYPATPPRRPAHSPMPTSCSISASRCSQNSLMYVFRCIPFGFRGNGSVMFVLPPSRSHIFCALLSARCVLSSRWLS